MPVRPPVASTYLHSFTGILPEQCLSSVLLSCAPSKAPFFSLLSTVHLAPQVGTEVLDLMPRLRASTPSASTQVPAYDALLIPSTYGSDVTHILPPSSAPDSSICLTAKENHRLDAVEPLSLHKNRRHD